MKEYKDLYIYNKENAKKVEILAPAGSYDIMKAVIQAGADAVYLGGDFFGARAFAGNFHKEELIDAIQYAHQFDRKIYLTVNTLLKEREIDDRLVEYLTPFYEAGLDAVIVQDFGVFRLIRKHFPDLHIHASTQMTQTGPAGAKLLYEAGATRVVTSRELNCSEIAAIHESCPVEIESFVHGALCYCYSGQCLLSSFNGGRSGNRGRCAQPCRLPYKAELAQSAKGKDLKTELSKEQYLCSPKDMCALPVLPDVIESGVYSLKIEGRMKNVTYAAGVTAIYRKYVDMYLSFGKKGYHVDPEDMNDLMDLYNRGAFTEGYYTGQKGKDMISLTRPNHMGTKALKVLENVNGRVTFQALEPIHSQDVFEIDKDHSFSSGSFVKTGDTLVVNLPRKYNLKPEMVLFRTRNNALTEWVKEKFVGEHLHVPVDISFSAVTDSPMSLTFYTEKHCVTVEGPQVGKAMKQPASESKVKEQLSKLGDTIFEAGHVELFLSEDAFIPASQLNELRRAAASQLLEQIRKEGCRHLKGASIHTEELQENTQDSIERKQTSFTENNTAKKQGNLEIHVAIEKLEQVQLLLAYDQVTEVYMEYSLLNQGEEAIEAALTALHQKQKKGILLLPYILKAAHHQRFYELIRKVENMPFDGYMVRNLEELGILGELHTTKNIYTDAGLYITNVHSKAMLKAFAEKRQLSIARMTLPYELTCTELQTVIDDQCELIAYGRVPLMLSEQCVRNTLGKCNHQHGEIVMENQNHRYIVKSDCSFCYTVTYDEKILDLTYEQDLYGQLKPAAVRLEFTKETPEEIRQILARVASGNEEKQTAGTGCIQGHFYRGVE